MKITNQQIQQIRDSYTMADETSKGIGKDKNPLAMSGVEQSRWNYWEGKRRALRDVIDLLKL